MGDIKDSVPVVLAEGLKYESSREMMDEFDEQGVVAPTVPHKYRGTVTDKRDMQTLGKVQVLRRNFKFVTMLGFASTVICTWEGLLVIISFVLTDGGTANLFWGYIVCAIGLSLVYASLAEMASMAPTAGGQYHWVSEFAPRSIQKPLSYIVGWQVFLASVAFVVGTVIQGLIILNYEKYEYQAWHGTLLAIAVIIFSIIFNTLFATRLPLIQGIVLIIHITGLFAIIIPLWALAPRGNPHDVLLTFTNNGGWPTTGLSAMIGLASPISSLLGYDCSVHMSEEIKDASATLPKAIMWSVVLNASMGFIMAVTIIFTLGDVISILETPTKYPFIQVFYNATQSLAATNIMTALIIICITSCCISEVATASRQTWSFARDNGLPFSDFLSQVTPGWNIPLRAVLVSLCITALLACINIGSNTALNAMNSLGGVSIISSYYITIGCVVLKRLKGEPLPARRWSLCRYGLGINIAALLFLTPIWFFYFWPLTMPVTAQTMNWAVLMYGGMIVVSFAYYFVKGRHVYIGPVMLTKRDLQN
ncbi:hypothetical protein EPUS_02079 [Endocarpon pusillum Z07020]|uniref:Uncharacterized protein n=1 Tax=Endocarpon pusillum (strain Z07020 / HMAS-L-300199) TaxID=1263415 RepID=U1G4G7_ENDPU|nr:uncharacterized protein EPUS_02079 [Endocarpon pusillum Z07020]ERF72192.1 hypothetical protein EPUS_02079 [Endocarpon pusillum Z07020]